MTRHRLTTIPGVPLVAGEALPALEETYTRDVWARAEEAFSAAAGDRAHEYRSAVSIHSDESLAESEGLPGRIAPGAVLLNWVSRMLVEQFGMGYVAEGGLQLKFVAPVMEGERVRVEAMVISATPDVDGKYLVSLDIEVLSNGERLCAVGTAEARIGSI